MSIMALARSSLLTPGNVRVSGTALPGWSCNCGDPCILVCCCSWLRRAWTCPGAKVGTMASLTGVVGEGEPARVRAWIVVGVGVDPEKEEVTEGLSTVWRRIYR